MLQSMGLHECQTPRVRHNLVPEQQQQYICILGSTHRVIAYGICPSWSGLLHFV